MPTNIPLTKFRNAAPPLCVSVDIYTKDASCLQKPSGVRWIILVKRTYVFVDTDDVVEWAAAISAGNIIVIPTSGKLNKPEMITIEGKGSLRKQNIANKFGFEVMADFPDNNMNYMNRINYQAREFGVMFVHNDSSEATTTAYVAMQDDAQGYAYVDLMAGYSHENPENREWYIKGEWSAKFMPQVLSIPRAILL